MRSIAIIPRIGLALLATVLLATGLLKFPILNIPLTLGLAAYMMLLYRYPQAWMIILPGILPVLDLGLWSGRFFFTEFDFILLATLAALYLRSRDRVVFPGLLHGPYPYFALLLISYLISTCLSVLPLQDISINSFSSYLSPYNGLRVLKGFLWAWLLLPFLVQHLDDNPERTKTLFFSGIVLGLGLAGIGALWERGVLVDLFWGANKYALLQSLLDFSGTYRITGLFSGMHIGGTSIDGYLALATPLALFPVIYGKSPWVRVPGLAVFALGSYAIMVTFSRGLLAGFGLSLLIIAVTQLLTFKRNLELGWGAAGMLACVLLIVTLLMFPVYIFGGYQALAVAILATLTSTLCSALLPDKSRKLLYGGLLILSLLTFWLIFTSLVSNKWTEVPLSTACILGVAAGLIFVPAPALCLRRLKLRFGPGTLMIVAVLLALFWGGTIPPISGIRVLARFAATGEDMVTRESHWDQALASMDGGVKSSFFGMGTGSFPRYFFAEHLGRFPLASYRFSPNPREPFLELGSGDFNIMQRIDIEPGQQYSLRVRARTPGDKATLSVKICHKHILYSERYTPSCAQQVFRFQQKGPPIHEWQWYEGTLDSGKLGRYRPFYWPTTLMLHNGGGSIVQIGEVSLVSSKGENIVRNGTFNHGSDRWFLVSDFEHLAWHTKNIYLHFYFEQGILGITAFLLLAAAAFFRLFKAYANGDQHAAFLIASLAGFMFVGLFGTVVDMPRVATLCYLLFGLAVAVPAKVKGQL